jgi:L-threonylcarbamoyladenylate synthase
LSIRPEKTELIYEKDLGRAVEILQREGVVAFPTETVFGLGARIFSEKAINKIFEVKGRPKDNPLIAHISDLGFVEQIAQNVPLTFYKLAEKFFPGPLTLVVPKSPRVPSSVSAGLSSIAIRMPCHPLALSLIRLVGEPLVAPSANLSGRPSSTDFLHVLEDFEGVIPGLIVGQGADVGIESTVVSLLNGKVEILRPGSISREELEEHLGIRVTVNSGIGKSPTASPGVKYKHYAPDAKLFLYHTIEEAIAHCQNRKEMKRMVLSNTNHAQIDQFSQFSLSPPSFYSRLRLADRCQFREVLIVCDSIIKKDFGFMNRIERAAGVY